MERRHFLKLAFGFAAGAAVLAAGAGADAAPLAPQPITKDPPGNAEARQAVTTDDEVDRLAPEPVRWGRRWGYRRRVRRRYWRRRYWRRRYW
jgi:hypothetical protein